MSPFFHEVVGAGDTIEMRGPIGGHFIWRAEDGGPLLLVGGGSGVVPLMSMLRHRAIVAPEVPAALIYSARTREELILRRGAVAAAPTATRVSSLMITLTREDAVENAVPRGPHRRRTGRRDARRFRRHAAAQLSSAARPPSSIRRRRLLLDMGVPFPSIKTERYGGDPARRRRRRPAGAIAPLNALCLALT